MSSHVIGGTEVKQPSRPSGFKDLEMSFWPQVPGLILSVTLSDVNMLKLIAGEPQQCQATHRDSQTFREVRYHLSLWLYLGSKKKLPKPTYWSSLLFHWQVSGHMATLDPIGKRSGITIMLIRAQEELKEGSSSPEAHIFIRKR